MSIALDSKDLERINRLTRGIKGGAEKVISRALNHVANKAKTELAQQITGRYKIKSADIKPSISVVRAKPQTLEARLDVKSYRLDLKRFGIKPQTDTTGSPHKKVTAEVLRGSPFEVKKGFVWQGHVFQRESDKRLPIQKLSGPAVPQMATGENVIETVEEHASEALRERVNHELTVLLNGWDKKK